MAGLCGPLRLRPPPRHFRRLIDCFRKIVARCARMLRDDIMRTSLPLQGVAMEDIMHAYAVRTTATWFAAIFVSSLFVTAATSAIGLL